MRTFFGILAATAIQACAVSSLPPPPAEDVRSQLRRVRISGLPAPAEIVLDAPVKGWLAGIPAGACDFATAFWEVGADPTADQAALLSLLAPVGLVVGAVYGPFAARPTEAVEREERSLREVLVRASSGFAARVEGQGRKACPSIIVREGEEAILHVGPAAVRLTGPYWLDPFVRPSLRMKVRLTRTDGQILYEAEITHTGSPRHFTRWASSPEELAEYFQLALDDLAERIVDEVFLTVLAPGK